MSNSLDKEILKLAKNAIKSKFENKDINLTNITKDFPELRKNAAVFVTLRKNGDLRGCIGSLIAHRSLADDIIQNAKSAAFSDPRFMPVTENEIKLLEIEISVLSEPKILEYADEGDLREKIIPKTHGVIIRHDNKSATFLPSVWDELDSFELFFSHLLQKANLPQDALSKKPEIYLYTARKIS